MRAKAFAVSLALGVTLGATLLGARSPSRYTLEGTVRDRQLGVPVVGATVSLLPSRRSAVTGEDGSFSFGPYQIAGAGQLVITHPDYRTVTLPLGTLGAEAWQLDITILRTAATVPDATTRDGGDAR